MKPFFSKKQIHSDVISKSPLSCASCGRYKDCHSPRMKYQGNGAKGILLIVESPGPTDDKRGLLLQDRRGRMIEKQLKEFGINVSKDCWTAPAVGCYADGKITPNELSCCRPNIMKIIKELSPKIIILFGDMCLDSIIGNRWKKKIGSIQTWNGWQIPDRELNAWICPVFHPWLIEYSEDKIGNQALLFWKRDLENALQCLGKSIPQDDEKKYVTLLPAGHPDFSKAMKRIIESKYIAFDYESTGLKPQAPGHKIICVSAAVSETECYSWENTPSRAKIFKRILENPDIKKSAHNLSFENLWSFVLMNADIKGWDWCSMNTAHILDNRRGITGLKFQTYVNFGVTDYDSEISEYLESKNDSSGANGINRIEEFIQKFGIEPVLTYCGLDSIFGFKLTQLQKERICKEECPH